MEEHLFEFMREELNQGFLALKLERWLKSNEDPDEALMMILQESDYYNTAEISRYRQKVAGIRKKHPAEYKKRKADALFSLRQYGRAVEQYRELLELPEDSVVNHPFQGSVWNNLGSCYARMFQTERAYEAYQQAYAKLSEPTILRQMYCLAACDGRLKFGDRLKALVSEEMQREWDAVMEASKKTAEQSDQVRQLEELFEKDSIRRQAGEAQLLHKWKQEYRAMV